MRGKDRAALRAEAHHLAVVLHVGVVGVTEPVVASLEDTLTAHELVKCQVAKRGDLKAREAAELLAARTGADVVQVIGRTFTLYRRNPDKHRAGTHPEPSLAPAARASGRSR